MERCAKAGITIPIVPGIMPITSYANTMRFCNGCGADLPRWIRLRLEELDGDKTALVEFGIGVVTRLCETLRRAGAALLHHQPGRSLAAVMEESGTGAAGQRVRELANSDSHLHGGPKEQRVGKSADLETGEFFLLL
jgi:hypothetical protein